jgi:hypothetical protein
LVKKDIAPHLHGATLSNQVAGTICAWAFLGPGIRNMGKCFLEQAEIPEPDAANTWFAYAGAHRIEIPKAISIWEDAATETGAESRRIVGSAGITIDPCLD